MLPMNCLIIIPTYNEEKIIENTINSIKKIHYNFIVINDGSTDGTWNILFNKLNKHQKYSYSPNIGKGYAIKIGAKLAFSMGYDYVLIYDADNQFNLDDINQFELALKLNPDAKIIIGNRLHNPKGMPFIRKITNKLMSFIISYLIKQKVYDSQCGFKLIHKDVFNLNLVSNRFDFESELLLKAGKAKMEIVNVPIQCIYFKERISKIHPIKDTIRFIKLLWRYYCEK